jgi:hypothetical protein
MDPGDDNSSRSWTPARAREEREVYENEVDEVRHIEKYRK